MKHGVVSGEAILSAENSGKPLGDRGPAQNPSGELTNSDSVAGARGLPTPALGLRSQFSTIRSWPQRKNLGMPLQ